MKTEHLRVSQNVLDCREPAPEPFVAPEAKLLSPSTWFGSSAPDFIAWASRTSNGFQAITPRVYDAIQQAFDALSAADRLQAYDTSPGELRRVLQTNSRDRRIMRSRLAPAPCTRVEGEPPEEAGSTLPPRTTAEGTTAEPSIRDLEPQPRDAP